MIIEIGSPSLLQLGFIRSGAEDDSRLVRLSLTLQHPPVHLALQKSEGISITGPRAHIADKFARRYLAFHGISGNHNGVIVEIELAVPSLMGLGSDAVLGLSVARGLARAFGHEEAAPALARAIGLGAEQAGAIWGFEKGGLLLTDNQTEYLDPANIVERVEIAHPEKEAWAFVFYFPYPPEGTPEDAEDRYLQKLLDPAGSDPERSEGSFPVPDLQIDDLVAAVQEDRFEDFGKKLMRVQQANLPRMGSAGAFSPRVGRDTIFEIMQAHGAAAWGQTLTGYSFWGLVKSGNASRRLRKTLQDKVGIFGGRVMATILDNRGAKVVEKEGQLGFGQPMRPRPGISSSKD